MQIQHILHLTPALCTHSCVRCISCSTVKGCSTSRWGCALQMLLAPSCVSSVTKPTSTCPQQAPLSHGSRTEAPPRHQPPLPTLAQEELILETEHLPGISATIQNGCSFLQHLVSTLLEFSSIPGFLLCLRCHSLYVNISFIWFYTNKILLFTSVHFSLRGLLCSAM